MNFVTRPLRELGSPHRARLGVQRPADRADPVAVVFRHPLVGGTNPDGLTDSFLTTVRLRLRRLGGCYPARPCRPQDRHQVGLDLATRWWLWQLCPSPSSVLKHLSRIGCELRRDGRGTAGGIRGGLALGGLRIEAVQERRGVPDQQKHDGQLAVHFVLDLLPKAFGDAGNVGRIAEVILELMSQPCVHSREADGKTVFEFVTVGELHFTGRTLANFPVADRPLRHR